ncbi:MAG: SRPBCC domain-containing protein [Oligoflexia bacterium]|nr:SRPBCC domain-containing protein [Oligoflexia bacterium]
MGANEANNQMAKVVVRKFVHASRERVFDAWTKPELMNQWFVGGKGKAKCSVDLRVGGTYTDEMFLDNNKDATCGPNPSEDVTSFMHSGEYLEIVRPEKLVFTWNSPFVKKTTVTVELIEKDSGTEVVLTHELPIDQCKGHETGWTFALANLGAYLG